MRTIAKLFGRSPFSPLQAHMSRVTDCVDKVVEIFTAVQDGDFKQVEKLAKQISKLEHKADLTKNEIRNNLPKGLFLAIDRGNLLEILGLQDNIADTAEDVGVLLTFTEVTLPEFMRQEFNDFLSKNIEAFQCVRRIIEELDELMEYSFGGNEAEKVNHMVEQVALNEHEVDIIQRKLVKGLFTNEDKISPGKFFLWMQIIDTVATLSNLSEKLANRVRMTLELRR